MMSKIQGMGNKDTEVALAKLFRAIGTKGWSRHYPITGRRDFAFPKQKLAVIVDGCFWHGCPKHGVQPKGNREFWLTKLAANKARDRKATRLLRESGWRVVRFWEHHLSEFGKTRVLERLGTIQNSTR